MGHSDIAMTMKYSHFAKEDLANAMLLLEDELCMSVTESNKSATNITTTYNYLILLSSLLIRSQLLYPVELLVRMGSSVKYHNKNDQRQTINYVMHSKNELYIGILFINKG